MLRATRVSLFGKTPELIKAQKQELIKEFAKKAKEFLLKYADRIPVKGKNIPRVQRFLLPDQPFPLNPFFKPIPPLSNTIKDKIFQLYLSDKQTYTPRRLAEKFKISIIRVNAILKMKSIEHEMVRENIPVQSDLSRNMDILLMASDQYSETTRSNISRNIKPFFKLVNEDTNFTPEDAAKLLKLVPFENVSVSLNNKAQEVFPDLVDEKVEKSREGVRFMVVDTSSSKITVREGNGKLRDASKAEIWYKKQKEPDYMHNK